MHSIKTKQHYLRDMKLTILSLAFLPLGTMAQSVPTDSITHKTEQNTDIGSSIFDEDQQLEDVVVVAQKPLVKMETDKMTYRVSDDSDSKTLSVLDMLRKVPMVTVDGQDNITVNGSSSFKVYVNGKPNMMFNSNPSQIFKAMPASMVKSIEVITNPGAQHDAEGTGGVLNIVMAGQGNNQTAVNGINGNVRADIGTVQSGLGAFLNGQYGKFSFSFNALSHYARTKGTEVEIERRNLTDGSSMHYKQSGKTNMPFQMSNLSMSYELDSVSTVSLTAGIHQFGMKNSGNGTTNMISETPFTYSQYTRSDQKNRSFELSLDYQRFLNKERTSSIAVIYQLSYDPKHNEIWNDYDILTDRFSDSREKSLSHILQSDYTIPIGKGHKFNTGVKFTNRNNSSDADFYLTDDSSQGWGERDTNTRYKHTDNILAGYAEFDGKWGQWGTKAGLRYEHTWQKVDYKTDEGEDFHKNYGNLVPTASISWQATSFANIGLTYTMRLSRPGITYLNPYVDRSSNTALTYGNPDLKVEKTHQIGLVYNMYTPKFMTNINLRQSINNNAISEYSFYDNEGLLNTTYGNIMRQRATTLSVWANYMLSKKTRIFMNAGFGYFHLESRAEKGDKNHGWQGNLMTGIQQTLPWDLKLGTFFITNSKKYTLQGWSSGFNMVMGNITKSFFNDKLNVGVQGMTGLRPHGRFYFDSYGRGKDFENRQSIHVPVANVSLNITWNFGNSKVKAKTKTTSVEDDVINRTNDMEQMNTMGQGGM